MVIIITLSDFKMRISRFYTFVENDANRSYVYATFVRNDFNGHFMFSTFELTQSSFNRLMRFVTLPERCSISQIIREK
jgi:hypothetical protein